jgi:DUF4097 and DUF4098 domain-containing protein YvlB
LRGGRERQRVSLAVVAIGSVLLLLALVMCVGLLAAGIVQGMAWAAGPVQATETRTFTVSGTPTLSLDVSAGNVHVVPGTDGQVTLALTKQVQAITRTAAQEALAATTIDATQDGDTIHVHITQPSFDGFPGVTNRSLELTVTVPASANLELTMAAGNLNAKGINGTLTGRVSAGNLELDDMTVSGASSLHVTAGNVEYHGALAPNASFDVSVTSGNIDISLPRTTSTHVQAGATAGNASVRGWPGVSETHAGPNSTISVDLNPPTTSTLSLQVTAGNVTVHPEA